MGLTHKQFVRRFNKLKLTDKFSVSFNSEFMLSINMLLQGIFELKTFKDDSSIKFPLARMLGALTKLQTKLKMPKLDLETPVNINFYSNLLILEEEAVKLLTIVNYLNIAFDAEDNEYLKSVLDKIRISMVNIAASRNMPISEIEAIALEVYRPIALYTGNKTINRLKHLKKKSMDVAIPSLADVSLQSMLGLFPITLDSNTSQTQNHQSKVRKKK